MDSYIEKFDGVLGDIFSAKREAFQLVGSFEGRFLRMQIAHYGGKEKEYSKKKLRGANNDLTTTIDTSANGPTRPESIVAQSSVEEVAEADMTYQRPVRTAKVKAAGQMKLPALNTKMRREDAAPTVKAERVSGNDGGSTARTTASPTAAASEPPKASMASSRTVVSTSTASSAPVVAASVPMPMREVRIKVEKLSILPDSEPKTSKSNGVTSDKANEKSTSSNKRPIDEPHVNASASKKVKSDDSIEIVQTDDKPLEISDDEAIMPPPPSVPPPTKKDTIRSTSSKKTDDSANNRPVRSTRSKQVTRAPVPPVQIKQEPVDPSEAPAEQSKAKPSTSQNQKDKKKPKHSRALSGDSVYEDAMAEPNRANATQTLGAPTMAHTSSVSTMAMDATFVTTSTENGPELLEARPTYVIPKEAPTAAANTTFNMPQSKSANKNNETMVISKGNGVRKASVASSIMTEDDSDSGSPQPARPVEKFKQPLPVAKNSKELFSPYQQKSTKQKIEIFEKLQSPVPQRQTRTKTRNKQLAAGDENDPRVAKVLGSDQQKPLRTNSATRYNTMAKPTVAATLTKCHSVDDVRKKNMAALAEEKKKKRDDKLRQAALQREANQNEKMEKYKKTVQEKEQRLLEAQKKKQQEELAKRLEQKRREEEREQKRIEAARREREELRIMAEKKMLEEQLAANKRAQAEKQKQKMYNAKNAYHFDMLESGDSTDCEEKETRKRPPPPEWSLKENRMALIEQESAIDSKYIDRFFSVEPRVVDLREIFPNIDDKHLRRNSSAIWNTPPRYSLMPKY